MMKRAAMIAAIAACSIAWGALAQDYPSRQVTLVIPTTTGTAADISARIFAPRLQQKFGRPVIVENRTGASGNIAVASVVKAPPDGHTVMITASTLAISPLLSKNLGWDPVKDLQPVALLSYITYVLLVNPAVPAHNVKELIALVRQKPGVLNYSSPGTGTPHQLAMELFKQTVGINITHVPYKGTAGAITDLVGGRVETAFFPVHAVAELVKAGKLRMIGSVGSKRTPWTPELPSFAEQGVPGIDVDAWIGVYLPAGTPAAINARLTTEFLALMARPEIREQLFSQGIVANPGGPDDLTRLLKSDTERYRKVVEQAKITLE